MRRPEVLLPVTFLAAILAGTAALLLPGMASERVGLLEAFFTATSSVCVTGLIVVDTGRDFTQAGQAVIAVLIQLGGLGIMTFSVLALVITGRRVALDHHAAVRSTFTTVASWRLGHLLAAILGMTMLLELGGFVLLRLGGEPAWSATFHAISAFCNAGFSLYADSLQRSGTAVMVPILALLILGGLGFTTLLEIGKNLWPRRHGRRRFSLHTRIVFTTSLILWGIGTLSLGILEGGDFKHALFMSASARTAGFDTTPVGDLSGGSLLILILLMFIGASPGSTGGGIKTTTFAVAVFMMLTALRGGERVTVHQRELPRRLVRRMFAVFTCSILVVFTSIFLLDTLEGVRRQGFLDLAFEAMSAFGTVGLSTGITAGLTTASKLVLCATMFIGRVGSLSIFLLVVRETSPSRVRYPEERVLIG